MGGTVSTKAPDPSLIVLHPSISKTTPDFEKGSLSHPPQYGFEEGKQRKERVMIATPEELESAKVPPKLRDFCAHKYIAFEACKKHTFPWVYKCYHDKHECEHCQYEDYLIRMKEYERERRLLHRKVRKDKKRAAAEAREAAAALEE